MGRKVRKTLNIDATKLKRVQRFLGVDTETEAIDRMLEDYDFERGLIELLEAGQKSPEPECSSHLCPVFRSVIG